MEGFLRSVRFMRSIFGFAGGGGVFLWEFFFFFFTGRMAVGDF